MRPVPEEYIPTVEAACLHLAEGAKLIMFIAQMLGDNRFTLDTPDGFRIDITEAPPPAPCGAELVET